MRVVLQEYAVWFCLDIALPVQLVIGPWWLIRNSKMCLIVQCQDSTGLFVIVQTCVLGAGHYLATVT